MYLNEYPPIKKGDIILQEIHRIFVVQSITEKDVFLRICYPDGTPIIGLGLRILTVNWPIEKAYKIREQGIPES